MKRFLLVAAVAALAAIAAVPAAVAAPPASLPDGPDLSVMALELADFPGSGKVAKQRYVTEKGTLAAYEREFELAGRLLFASSSVSLVKQASTAQKQLVALRKAVSTARGRAAFGKAFSKEMRPLKVKSASVSAPVSISAGNYAFRFGIRVSTNVGRLHVAFGVVRVDRTAALIVVLARPGQTVAPAQMVRLVRLQADRLRAGFAITSVTAPVVTGNPAAGQTLTADRGRWTGGPTQFTYQWARCDAAGLNCVDIAGATAATYTVAPADTGSTILVRVQARNPLSELAVSSTPLLIGS